jgi:hypothetical protein
MARNGDSARVAFTGGYVFKRDYVCISSYLEENEEDDHARIFTFAGGKWYNFDLEFRVRSVYGVEKPARTLYCLGIEGQVLRQTREGPAEERIRDAGLDGFGYLHTLRQIDGKLYACGVSGQIYRREKSGWVHFDEGVLHRSKDKTAADIYCVDGTSAADIYAVGEGGVLWHYDGKMWARQQPLIRRDLEWVKCVSETEVYLCGGGGNLFRGYAGKWGHFALPPKWDEDFWCVEVFDGKPYIAGDSGIYELGPKGLVPVETGLKPEPDGFRLHANDGVLWSFGSHHLCFFDGKKWTYVKHPDNP